MDVPAVPDRAPPRHAGEGIAIARATLYALGASALLIFLSWRLFSDPEHLLNDFGIDMWLIEHQAESLRLTHAPSLFLSSDRVAFYPVFAFYGGTLLAFTGALALIVGSAAVAEAIVYVLALSSAYGGWFWLSRMAGLRSWSAHAPAILYVTAPYVLTNMYVRQDLAEIAATSAIPLLLASALSLLESDRLRAAPAAALAVSTLVLGGSHNLTLLWGTTILAITAVGLLAAVPRTRSLITRRGLLRVFAIVLPATAVNGWYLLPDIAYQSHTVIAHRVDEWRKLLRDPGPVIDAKYLFAIGRPSAFPGSGLSCTLPVLAMGWVVLAGVATLRRSWRQTWGRTLLCLSAATILVLVVMTHPQVILELPRPWQMIQFSYRLESFALFGICGSVIAALVLVDRSPRRWLKWLLLPILVLSVTGAAKQIHDAPRSAEALEVHRNATPFSLGDYADASATQVRPTGNTKALNFQWVDAIHGHLDGTHAAMPGDVILTNLMAIPQMIDVQGARIIGTWKAPPSNRGWQPLRFVALRVDPDATPNAARIVVRQARSFPIVGGQILSLLGLLGLAANAVVIARGARRRRRARPAAT